MNHLRLLGLCFWGFINSLQASPVHVDIHDKAALQRGARQFMNYCSGCHSLRYLRYNRMAEDLDITTPAGKVDKPLFQNNLIFTSAKISDPIRISMPETDARQWFGRLPPDLSLTAEERGPVWIYRYLTGFYADSTQPYGANNHVVPDSTMPNILAPMPTKEQEQTILDIVTFLTYVADPTQTTRQHIGYFIVPLVGLIWLLLLLSRTRHRRIIVNQK